MGDLTAFGAPAGDTLSGGADFFDGAYYYVSEPTGREELKIRTVNFTADGSAITSAIYALATRLGGSFSAEHGVGSLKRHFLPIYRSEPEVALMRTLKKALDPKGILNPGKVI